MAITRARRPRAQKVKCVFDASPSLGIRLSTFLPCSLYVCADSFIYSFKCLLNGRPHAKCGHVAMTKAGFVFQGAPRMERKSDLCIY